MADAPRPETSDKPDDDAKTDAAKTNGPAEDAKTPAKPNDSRRRRRRGRADDAESEPLPLEPDETVPDHVFAQQTELVESIKRTADKLLADGATRGDLKILERSLKELRYAFKMFTPYRKRRKVSVFGSARTAEVAPEYAHAEKFGRRMAEEGWMVLTGAGGGIMEAAHVGAGREMSMGVNILLPFEQHANRIIDGDPKLANLKYFFTRKLLFVKEVHGIVTFPGGFGTQDEAFETLTLVQTGKRDLMPLVWVDEPDGNYWGHWQQFVNDELLEKGLISPEDTSLYKITTDVEEAVEEILNFYSVYNSMRYVRGKLVLRLHAAPDDQLLERINDEFNDICASGEITCCGAHQQEADDEHLADLPRLRLDFNRRSAGRLRQLVDLLNDELADAPNQVEAT
ncbi:LOG family protein [Alienimonas sp. DA493]|uniref:LOG family protein n=1 Tax=Alienimonas sp. DA493 TaxID=3373605 RepID=UPI0037540B8D